MPATDQELKRYQRIEANCRTIWGADKSFDIFHETDDWLHYICFVREDSGLSIGPVLVMTNACDGQDRAWNELDRMLHLWASQTKSGRPMTREKRLEISSGPNGEYRNLLEKVENIRAAIDAEAGIGALAAARKA